VLEAAQRSLDEGHTIHLDHPDAGTTFAGKQMDTARVAGLGNGNGTSRSGVTILDREPVGSRRGGQ
jgi:hypothetical protein